MTSTLTDYLQAMPDEALASLLSRRPDVLTPPPSDLSGLAARLQSRVSIARALDGLDLFHTEILDACRLTRIDEPPHITSTRSILAHRPPRWIRTVVRSTLRRSPRPLSGVRAG